MENFTPNPKKPKDYVQPKLGLITAEYHTGVHNTVQTLIFLVPSMEIENVPNFIMQVANQIQQHNPFLPEDEQENYSINWYIDGQEMRLYAQRNYNHSTQNYWRIVHVDEYGDPIYNNKSYKPLPYINIHGENLLKLSNAEMRNVSEISIDEIKNHKFSPPGYRQRLLSILFKTRTTEA